MPSTTAQSARVDHAIFSGTFSLDGETFEVDNNIWVVGDDEECIFTGDTLFHGGPGATGRSYSDRRTLECSIQERLFTLSDATLVHTGHGESTTIGVERNRTSIMRHSRGRRLPGEEECP